MKKVKNWEDKPMTERQKIIVENLYEFSEHRIPKFVGTTQGEASKYINTYLGHSPQEIIRYPKENKEIEV